MHKLATVLFSILLSSTIPSAFAAETSPAPSAVKDWTLLIYLNGDNSLDNFGPQNIDSMEQVGSNSQLNIVVQWASLAAGKTERLYIEKENDSGTTVSSPVIQDMGVVDMGDVKSLNDFISWGITKYPAKHYFIDVWDHGSGWHSIENLRNRAETRGGLHALDISWDDNSGHSITTEQLGQSIAQAAKLIGHKVDIYGSDACMMAMAEVANEMLGSVSIFVGSEETEPGAGWPYADFLGHWMAAPNSTPSQIAGILVNDYVKSYEGGSNGTDNATFAAFDMSQLPALDQALASFSTKVKLLDATDRTAVLTAAQGTQNFIDSDYGDLMDFIAQLQSTTVRALSSVDLSEVEAAASKFVIANADTSTYAKAKGVSFWLPTSESVFSTNSQRYQGMKFDEATHWGDALAALVAGTQ